MYLRSALLTDLPVLSNIAYLAFQNSTMYNHFSPLHSRYPVQFRKFLRDELWLRIISPRQVVIVAEMDDDDYNSMGASILENTRVKETSETESNKKVIVGYACWIFRADRVVPERWNCDTLLRRIQRALLIVQLYYHALLIPDRTTDFQAIQCFHQTAANVLEALHITDYIELNTLTVHPGYQRMGIGAVLMDWGLNQAEEEKLDVVLEATEAGIGLYERKGFEIVGTVELTEKIVEERMVDRLSIPVMVFRTK